MDEAEAVIAFWFAPGLDERWFVADPAFDAEIRERFQPLVERAAAGDCDDWIGSPRGALALCLLLDQFPRNIWRGSPLAYACDAKAREVSRAVIAAGLDRQLPAQQRPFLYLPFEHSENIDDQHRCIELVRRGCPGDPEIMRYALMHREVIAKYGRFPHRNAILGRRNTPEEDEYLKQPGAGF